MVGIQEPRYDLDCSCFLPVWHDLVLRLQVSSLLGNIRRCSLDWGGDTCLTLPSYSGHHLAFSCHPWRMQVSPSVDNLVSVETLQYHGAPVSALGKFNLICPGAETLSNICLVKGDKMALLKYSVPPSFWGQCMDLLTWLHFHRKHINQECKTEKQKVIFSSPLVTINKLKRAKAFLLLELHLQVYFLDWVPHSQWRPVATAQWLCLSTLLLPGGDCGEVSRAWSQSVCKHLPLRKARRCCLAWWCSSSTQGGLVEGRKMFLCWCQGAR